MTRLVWSKPEDRLYETGLDRGVLYLNDGRAVPWNGLTSVEQQGGEEVQTYYMDGRPFLHLPKPREYVATLSAYTYPDEFSAVMGVSETADGMYLDSQQGDSFNLSYRTLIGGDVNAQRRDYKIHLIYNASVNPSASSHEALSDSVNPVEFSWEIQAVPEALAGFRPTAHVVLDTRHLDSIRLTELEVMLYGDASTAPEFPDINELFNLLNFGDVVVVYDNADGTWMAEGSYRYVYMTGNGVFQLDNVDAVDNGDGTYTMTTA